MQSRSQPNRFPVTVRDPKECPNIVLIVGPSRSGTTALERVFTQAGIPAVHELTKRLGHKRAAEDPDYSLELSDIKHPTLVIKDSLGGGRKPGHAIHNPVEELLESGVPRGKVQVITLMREPLANITSLLEVFSDKIGTEIQIPTLVENTVAAYRATAEARQYALGQGIRTTTMNYDVLRDHPGEEVIEALFQRIGLEPTQGLGKNWQDEPTIDTAESGMIHITSLSPVFGSAHRTLHASEGFGYIDKSAHVSKLITPGIADTIELSGAYDMYELFRQASEVDLGLSITPSRELQEFRRGLEVATAQEGGMFRRKEG